MNGLHRLTVRHWGWLIFKVILGVLWPISVLVTSPPTLVHSLGWIVGLIAITTLTGGLTSIVGLIMSAQTGAKAVIGLTIELVGLHLFIIGPFTDATTLLLLCFTGWHGTPGYQLMPSMLFALAMVSAIINRILIVAPRRAKEAHDQSKRM